MSPFGKIGAFLFGAILTILVVGILDDTFPWFWLPLLCGVALIGCAVPHRWLQKSGLTWRYGFAAALAVCTTYSASSKTVTTRLGPLVPQLAILILLSACAFAVIQMLSAGLAQKAARPISLWLLIPVTGCAVVGMVSGGVGGADHMVVWLLAHTHLTQARAEELVHYFRKGIHLSAYGLVGLALSRAALSGKATNAGAWMFALSSTLCLASFDEIRQTTAPNRSGSAWDVALDMTGAALFIAAAMIFSLKKRNSSAS